MTTNPVLAALDGSFADEIDFAIQYGFEFLLHLSVFEESPLGIWGKGDKEVDIAVVGEVIVENRAKNSKFGNLPTLTKVG